MQSNKFLVPGAVVVAGILIAGAVFFTGDDGSSNPGNDNGDRDTSGNINPITSEDHILGNPEAEVKIVEYSDIDCPYCSRFHTTMSRIIDDYGTTGEVAWVFRHFPLTQIHPDARAKAIATECVASLEGNDAFWSYLDILFEREDEDRGDLTNIAVEVGVSENQFEECIDQDAASQAVAEDSLNARDLGIQGTPHSIIFIESTGEEIALEGAQPYSAVSQVLDTILENNQNTQGDTEE